MGEDLEQRGQERGCGRQLWKDRNHMCPQSPALETGAPPQTRYSCAATSRFCARSSSAFSQTSRKPPREFRQKKTRKLCANPQNPRAQMHDEGQWARTSGGTARGQFSLKEAKSCHKSKLQESDIALALLVMEAVGKPTGLGS